ncbi:MAG TPA: hypothetical protein VEB21_19285 [Terriglobales bacterium]|nr:hypothetical protein [Terriglobales bacterium]
MRVAYEQGTSLEQALQELLGVEPYLAYANFAPIGARDGALIRLHRQRYLPDGERRTLVARDSHGRPLAALAVAPRPFETQHFGMPMAKVEVPLAVAGDELRLTALRELYDAAWSDLAGDGCAHVAASVSANDRVAAWAIQELGTFYVGTRISWMQPLTGAARSRELAPGLRVETYDRSTIAALEPASYGEILEWCGRAFDRGPYVFDVGVPYELSTGIYRVWTQKALTGEWADTVIVIRDGDRIVSFHTMLWMADLSAAAGLGIVGRGIGASLPGYPGLFTALQMECSALRPLGASFLENEAQASSIQSIQVFGKLGHRCLRSVASFHRRF